MTKIIGLCLVSVLLFSFSSCVFTSSESAAENSSKGKKESKGKKNGIVKTYHDNGKLKTSINYVDGVKDGQSYLYFEDGETILLELPYVKGKREGVSKKYYENGKLYTETSYQNNELHGLRKVYYRKGGLKSEIPYGYGFRGVGGKEYLLSGKEKPSPVIKILKRGDLLIFPKPEGCKKSKFFIGNLVEDKYLNPIGDVRVMQEVEQGYFIDLELYLPSRLAKLDAICECKSSQGNTLILKKSLKGY